MSGNTILHMYFMQLCGCEFSVVFSIILFMSAWLCSELKLYARTECHAWHILVGSVYAHLPCSLCAVTPKGSVFVIPQSVSVSEGNSVTFMCVVAVAGNYDLQWSHNGMVLPGENQTLLNVNAVTAAQGGTYTCSVVNVAGSGVDEGVLYGEYTVKPV